ncbi:dTMP kinase [Actinomadura algeriensis]|uniref:Thymidylate kinase n=1 Tax=Actinomadura algeriensis TaxID=1679523 RepID=A0ABR9JQT9_9ACTN|nr:dTMP kinase [Actinomadura algeriensis]MBE1532892.1 dTMP kinase [Actinomadura algeriensis]
MTRTDATRPYPAAPPPGVSSLSELGPFRRLRPALSLSAVGQWLTVPALTASAVALTQGEDAAARAQAVGVVLGLLLLPAVLLAPLAGLLAARVDRRVALLGADALRFVIVLTVPLLDMLPWTFAAAFLAGLLSLLWTPVALAAPPALVPDGLPDDGPGGGTSGLRAAARRSALRTVSAAAPAAAALFTVLALVGAGIFDGAGERTDLVLYANAAVFLLAAVAVALIKDVAGAEPVHVPSPLALIFRGGRGGRTGAPRGLGAAVTGAALAAGAVTGAARLHAAGLGGGDAGYGAVLLALTAGLGFGIFLGPRVLRPFSRRRLLGLAVVAGALALIVTALVGNLPVAVVATALTGVAAGVAWACGTSVLAPPADPEAEAAEPVEPPSRAYPRAVALVTAFVAVAAVPPLAGALGDTRIDLGGGVYDLAGTGAALLIAAVVALLAGLLAYRRADDRRGVPLVPDLRAALRGEVYVPPGEEPVEADEPAAVRNRGVFIAFEGGEGAGKTTQARLAAIWLRDHGYDVVTTQEPGATKIGMRLRAMLLDRETTGLSIRAESLLYAADRADHVTNVIAPALDRGAIVVSDRYVDSSLAYQGFGRQQPVDEIARVNEWATGGLVPDLTVLLEVPPRTGLNRLSAPADRIESEPQDFHERVRGGFRALADAEPERYLVLDASRPQAELSREIQYRIREILPDPIPLGTEDATHTFPAIRDV